MKETARRFHAIFNGLNRAYGIYIVPPPGSGAKRTGDARTVAAPVTDELWERHLKGEIQLGIVPIRDDALCVFGAIDVDDYNCDHKFIAARIKKLKLPLVLCRSKSGGAHLYSFFKLPTEATRVRELLAGWAAALGYAKVEIFPKQDRLHSAQDTGNWINMPYSGGEATERYALLSGDRATPKAFLDYAEHHRVDPDTVDSTGESPELLTGAPPCLVTLANGGIPEGQRNNTLFSLAIYARKRWPFDWDVKLSELNANFVSPPLASSEVSEVIRNVSKKEYNYPCKQEPICAVCQRAVCRNREFGVSAQAQTDAFGLVPENVVRIEVSPVLYFADISGKRIKFTSTQLCSQARMRETIIEQTNTSLPRMTGIKYDRWLGELLAKAQLVSAPEETASGQHLLYALGRYCYREAPNRTWPQLLLGGSRIEGERIYFNPQAFVSYANARMRGREALTESLLWITLANQQVHRSSRRINGCDMEIVLWSLPAKSVLDYDHYHSETSDGDL